MRFLIDMNLSPGWVPFLQAAGFEATHWSSVGAADAHDHIVVTNDLDFSTILAATQRSKPSVIQIRADLLTPSGIGSAVLRAIAQTGEDLAAGALVSIDADRSRVRILPLGS